MVKHIENEFQVVLRLASRRVRSGRFFGIIEQLDAMYLEGDAKSGHLIIKVF